jgi:hypothetical protein
MAAKGRIVVIHHSKHGVRVVKMVYNSAGMPVSILKALLSILLILAT